MRHGFRQCIGTTMALLALSRAGCVVADEGRAPGGEAGFSFIVAADMRMFTGAEYDTKKYFFGACDAVKAAGKGAFMVSPGDIDFPWQSLETIRKVLGEDYPWIPVVGNHEIRNPKDMEWLREWGKTKIPNLVNRGPENCEETTFSFDFGNAHFVVINEYYDGKSDAVAGGDISPPLYEWLKEDLEKNTKPFVFVFGHEPMLAIPDYDSGIHRHQGDSLDAHPRNNHRFRQLMREHQVTAYICGHTHCFSYANINGVWQLDAGHCRGFNKFKNERELRSTFLKIRVGREKCWVDVYRANTNGWPYRLTQTIEL